MTLLTTLTTSQPRAYLTNLCEKERRKLNKIRIKSDLSDPNCMSSTSDRQPQTERSGTSEEYGGDATRAERGKKEK